MIKFNKRLIALLGVLKFQINLLNRIHIQVQVLRTGMKHILQIYVF